MLLPYAGKDKIPGFLIAMDLDRRIFFHHPVEALRNLLFVGFRPGLQCKRDQRRKVHRSVVLNRRLFIAKRIPRDDIFEFCRRHNLAGRGLLDDLLFFPFQSKHLPEFFFGLFVGVEEAHILRDLSRDHAHDRQFSGKGIDDGFKNVGRKWRARILCSLLSFTGGRIFAFHLSFVQRRWEIVYHCFQELRDADLACGRSV